MFAALSRSRAEQAARALALTRVGVGVVALAVPQLPAAVWVGGPESRAAGTKVLVRALGGRDLALGLGVLFALRRRAPVRGWLEAGSLADLGDGVATLLAFGSVPRRFRWPVLASALGSAAAASLIGRSLGTSDEDLPTSAGQPASAG
jgi:hypothetical protein